MKLLSQSLMLLASFVAVFLWQASPLADLTVPALGFLIFLYLILSKSPRTLPPTQTSKSDNILGKREESEADQQQRKPIAKEDLNIFILNTIILLLIFTTGGLHSPLYFLLYFISFGIAFVLLPETVFAFIIGSILLFLPDALVGEVAQNLLQLGSLALISPLAFFFGREYRTRQAMQERNAELAEKITEQAGDVLEREEDSLSYDEKAELANIIKESEELKKD